jgi:hypothetical protein
MELGNAYAVYEYVVSILEQQWLYAVDSGNEFQMWYNAGNGAGFTTNVASPAVRHKDLTWTDVGLPWHVGAGPLKRFPNQMASSLGYPARPLVACHR